MALKIDSRLLLILFLILQSVITLPFLGDLVVELDEPFTIFYAQQDANEFIPAILEGNNTPLFYLLLHYWIEVFGFDVFLMRLLPFLISLVTIGIVFQFFVKRTNQIVASTVTLLLIFSRMFHHFSFELRMYGLFILFGFLVLRSLYIILFEAGGKQFIYLGLWNALFIYTHYLGIYIVGLEVILLVVYCKKLKRHYWLYFLSGLIIMLGSLSPILIYLYKRASEFTELGSWLTKPKLSYLYGNIFKLFNNPFTFLYTFLFISLIIILSSLTLLDRGIWI